MSEFKSQFPIFKAHPDLVYLDTAATAQKPQAVIDSMTEFLSNDYATIHRGVYELSQIASTNYANARKSIQGFIGAKHDHEVIITKGCTEAINLVAHSYGQLLNEGDEILISEIEHHANVVPWQQIAKQKGLQLKLIPVLDTGDIDLEAYDSMLSDKTALVAIAHVSNVIGAVHPINSIIERAHSHGAKVLIDGAQSAPHLPINVQELDCDFYTISGHKLYGPTGIGVLYGKTELLEQMPPYQTGGDMIETVAIEETTFAPLPAKFEAGTPPIAECLALATAIEFCQDIGISAIKAHDDYLINIALEQLKSLPGLEIIGNPSHRSGVVSFSIKNAHPHDIGTILDSEHIAIRAGHHCSQLAMKRFGISATARASFGIYNTEEDIDALVKGIKKVQDIFQ